MRNRFDSYATKSQIDRIMKALNNYAPLSAVRDIKHDMLRMTKNDEFILIQSDVR